MLRLLGEPTSSYRLSGDPPRFRGPLQRPKKSLVSLDQQEKRASLAPAVNPALGQGSGGHTLTMPKRRNQISGRLLLGILEYNPLKFNYLNIFKTYFQQFHFLGKIIGIYFSK
jgi:hypothetical protein